MDTEYVSECGQNGSRLIGVASTFEGSIGVSISWGNCAGEGCSNDHAVVVLSCIDEQEDGRVLLGLETEQALYLANRITRAANIVEEITGGEELPNVEHSARLLTGTTPNDQSYS